jgi:hypothetical protein
LVEIQYLLSEINSWKEKLNQIKSGIFSRLKNDPFLYFVIHYLVTF